MGLPDTSGNIKIEKPKQLLVEGQGPVTFFEAFIRHLRLRDIQIQNFYSVSQLRGALRSLVRSRGFPDIVCSIGIVRDAEGCAASALQSVQGSLRKAELPVPSDVGKLSGGWPAVTVLILPDGQSPGMLETLLCRSFADEPVNRCIDDFFGCVDSLPGTSSARRDKARARAYLATRPHPDVSVGVAALKKYWRLDHDVFSGVRSFLKSL